MQSQEALYPLLREEELTNDRRGTVATAEYEDVIVLGDGCEAELQAMHRLIEPLSHHCDQGPEEDHVTENGQNGGDGSDEHAVVVAEISRIRQSKEGPPDGLSEGGEAGGDEVDGQSGDAGNEDHQNGQDEQARKRTAEDELLDLELEPVPQSLDHAGRPSKSLAAVFCHPATATHVAER